MLRGGGIGAGKAAECQRSLRLRRRTPEGNGGRGLARIGIPTQRYMRSWRSSRLRVRTSEQNTAGAWCVQQLVRTGRDAVLRRGIARRETPPAARDGSQAACLGGGRIGAACLRDGAWYCRQDSRRSATAVGSPPRKACLGSPRCLRLRTGRCQERPSSRRYLGLR